MAVPTLYRAAYILNPTPDGRLVCQADGAIVVDSQGLIQACGAATELQDRFPAAPVEDFGPHSLLLPGLVDVHTHLPQYQAIALDRGELLQWLNTLIFPLEQRYADPNFAEQQAELFFRAALRAGTTTLAVFGPPFPEATSRAFAVAARLGLRVLMGQTLMDTNVPESLRMRLEDVEPALEHLVELWHGYDSGRLLYAVTPRFAGSCTLELLRLCAAYARRHGLLLQTHLAESLLEISWIAELFPSFPDYTAIYEAAGLLTPRTLCAHCLYLSATELERLRRAGCAIAHCPRSNLFLRSGIMPLQRYRSLGFRIGLGSDIGAGYSLCLLEEARYAREMTKVRALLAPEEIPTEITPEEALWLATLGGAQALGLDERIGSLEVGKEADFIVIDTTLLEPQNPLYTEPEHLSARLLYTATPAAIRAVFVRGKALLAPRDENGSRQSAIS